MPLISTLGNIGAQSFGTRGLKYGGSALFNAGGDYLTTPQNAVYTHTGNFTIEMWVYPTNLSVINLLWRQAFYGYLWISPGGQVAWYHGSNPWSFSATTVTANQWNHVAVVRNAGTITLYINGVGSGSVFNTNTVTTGINPLIGSWDGTATYQFYGYLTNLRVARQAIYTANFTPSGIPLTVNSQGSTTTQLLLNMRTASTLITDSSTNNFALANVGVTYSDFTPFLQPYVTPGVVVLQSAVVTPTTFTPSEGTTITFNVVGTNTPNGTYYYTIEEDIATGAVTAADFTSGSLSGTFSISGNSGSFPLTVSRDLVTEGSEEFNIYVRKDSTTGQVLGTSGNIIISDTSLTPSFTVAPSNVNEGSTASFTVENVGPNGTYFWTVLNGTTANADFSTVSGSFVVSGSTGGLDNGTGSFSVTALADRTTEGAQTFQVQVRSGSTSGTVVLTSGAITINDISLTPFANFTNNSSIAELAGNNGGLATSTTIQVGNLGPAGTYYWSIVDNVGTLTAADLTVGSLTGSFTTSTLNGTANLTFTAAADTVAEANGWNIFQVQIREGSTSGTVLATSNGSIILYDSSVVVTLLEPNPASEGNGFNITVSTNFFQAPGVVPGQYFLTFESTGSATAADIAGLPFGFNITSQGNYGLNGVVSVVSLDGIELSETFRIGVRQGTTTGPLVGISPVITINASAT
jgi:hypothetical protein